MATPTLFATDFLNQFIKQMQEQSISFAVEFSKMMIEMIWLSLKPYWPYLAIGFFVLLLWLTIKAMLGEWGALGSLIYHVIYFAILGIFIAIKGWEIIFNPLFDLLAWIFYRFSYWLTGLILSKMGLI